MSIDESRAKIDKIDEEILSLFLLRMELSEKIAQYKRQNGLAITDSGREREILDKIAAKSGAMAEYSGQLFQCLFRLSKQRQAELLAVDDKRNIVLIGMPSCGKTTVGLALSKLTGRRFIDTDEEIVKKLGISIEEYFEARGEASFRALERVAVTEAAENRGVIIATGGGTVTREDNLAPLKRNSRVYHLERDLSLLAVDGRPLSKSTNLAELYEKRLPLYVKFRDAVIDNNGEIEETVQNIWRDFCEKPL